MMYENVIKEYPQMKQYLNDEKEFCFCDPTDDEVKLIHKIMREFWLSVIYNSIDGQDWYFIYDYEERLQKDKEKIIDFICYYV